MLKTKNFQVSVRLRRENGEGNLLLIIISTGFMVMIIFLSAAAVLLNHINSIMYTIKVDMFLINRSAIIALNKDLGGKGINDIDKNDYYKYFKKALQQNYGLNDQLEGGNKLIEKIDILAYEYETVPESVIKTEINVKVSPIVFKSAFKDIFRFRIKQDVKLNKVLN